MYLLWPSLLKRKEALKIVTRKGEAGTWEEELHIVFRQRADSKRWKQALEQAIVAIHVTLVLYDLEWTRLFA